MIAKFLNEKYTVSRNGGGLIERLKEFSSFGDISGIDFALSDGKAGNWFLGAYHEGEKDSGKFLCFSYSNTVSDDVADFVVLAFECDNERVFRKMHKIPVHRDLNSIERYGHWFPLAEKEAAKRSSAFVRNMVKKLASLSSWEEMTKFSFETMRKMQYFDWVEMEYK